MVCPQFAGIARLIFRFRSRHFLFPVAVHSAARQGSRAMAHFLQFSRCSTFQLLVVLKMEWCSFMESKAILLSDRDLTRRVKGFLGRQHFASLRSIEVDSSLGVVTLSGRVNSFHERQLCINCCQRVAGVVGLNDRIEVAREHKMNVSSFSPLGAGRPALAG